MGILMVDPVLHLVKVMGFFLRKYRCWSTIEKDL